MIWYINQSVNQSSDAEAVLTDLDGVVHSALVDLVDELDDRFSIAAEAGPVLGLAAVGSALIGAEQLRLTERRRLLPSSAGHVRHLRPQRLEVVRQQRVHHRQVGAQKAAKRLVE